MVKQELKAEALNKNKIKKEDDSKYASVTEAMSAQQNPQLYINILTNQ